MRSLSFSVVLTLGLISMSQSALAQGGTNTSGPIMWPNNPPVGIGTVGDGTPQNALQIHHDPARLSTLLAMIRLSDGSNDSLSNFGLLGLMPDILAIDTPFSSLSTGYDLILHEHENGDIIITNYTGTPLSHILGGAIRFATTGDTILRSSTSAGHHDLERMTIMDNGNIGIDLPPNDSGSMVGLDSAVDQLQIGGGIIPDTLETDPTPGLTIYGGNRFEGLPKIGGGLFPADWRYINFNNYIDHSDSSSNRFKRFAKMGSCGIAFSNRVFDEGGVIQLNAMPYSPLRGKNDFSRVTTLQVEGNTGLALWIMDTLGNHYHHLFDVFPPGDTNGGIRNTNGLSYFHTPLCITSDHGGDSLINFTGHPGLYPDIGPDSTWMLVVNGSELAKEIFVLDSTWADYVFDPGYKLPPITDVENYTKKNHHLPDIPSAKQIAKTGVPVGRTEAAITKQLEEMMLYIEQLNHKIEGLESEVKELKNGKEK